MFIGRTDEAETPILWPPDAKSWLIWKDPEAWKDWSWEKGMTEDEMVGWHYWLNGHEFEQTPGVGDGQAAWCAAVHGVTKSQTWLSDWTELNLGVGSELNLLGCFYVSPGKSRSPGDSPIFKLNGCFSRKPLCMSWAFSKVHMLILYKLICSCQQAPLSSHH